MSRHLEMIFPNNNNLDPADVVIITPATDDRPGRARLAAARVEAANGNGCRVYSANGGAMIGVIAYDDPWWPYQTTYLLEDSPIGKMENSR